MLSKRRWLVLIILLLLGVVLRAHVLDSNRRLHGDEALFASYGRHMVLQGNWNLYEVPIDKPPLTFAMVGISTYVVGQHEFAVRLPNLLMSMVALAVFYRIGAQVSGRYQTGIVALALYAMSPLAIAHAPTAFQDQPMITLFLVAMLLALRRRWTWAGAMMGLAFCMKPTALYLTPLVIAVGVLQVQRIEWRRILCFGIAHAVPIVLLVLWDESRIAQSFFALGRHHNDPGRFIRADEVWLRLDDWLRHLGGYVGVDGLTVLFVGLVLLWLWRSFRQHLRGGLEAWLFATYIVLYVGFHWLVAFPTYDRYLLPLIPLFFLLVAQALRYFASKMQQLAALIVVLVVVMLPSALNAHNRIDPAVADDIDDVAMLLNESYAGQIVYDFALNWHLQWYLGEGSTVIVVYWPTPEQLAAHMQHDDGLRYLIAPNATAAIPWRALLAAQGIESYAVYDHGGTALYELLPPSVVSDGAGGSGSGFSSGNSAENNPN